jgi:hypothetical protein
MRAIEAGLRPDMTPLMDLPPLKLRVVNSEARGTTLERPVTLPQEEVVFPGPNYDPGREMAKHVKEINEAVRSERMSVARTDALPVEATTDILVPVPVMDRHVPSTNGRDPLEPDHDSFFQGAAVEASGRPTNADIRMRQAVDRQAGIFRPYKK